MSGWEDMEVRQNTLPGARDCKGYRRVWKLWRTQNHEGTLPAGFVSGPWMVLDILWLGQGVSQILWFMFITNDLTGPKSTLSLFDFYHP